MKGQEMRNFQDELISEKHARSKRHTPRDGSCNSFRSGRRTPNDCLAAPLYYGLLHSSNSRHLGRSQLPPVWIWIKSEYEYEAFWEKSIKTFKNGFLEASSGCYHAKLISTPHIPSSSPKVTNPPQYLPGMAVCRPLGRPPGPPAPRSRAEFEFTAPVCCSLCSTADLEEEEEVCRVQTNSNKVWSY